MILEFLRMHPSTWSQELEARRIAFRVDGDYAIFYYLPGADFSDPLVQECRGIIVDLGQNPTIVCWPFRKFGNYGELYADDIDWTTARVQEKVDGSIVKLWWAKDHWQWSTNHVIDAKNAELTPQLSFYDGIKMADAPIEYETLSKEYTYIFEFVSPYNTVVVHYPNPQLYLLGVRHNRTGVESAETPAGLAHLARPAEYAMNSLEEVIAAAKALNTPEQIAQEGFVVVDAHWHRIKVKSPEYFMNARLSGMVLTKHNALALLDEYGLGAFEKCPEQNRHILAWYYYQTLELRNKTERAVLWARSLFDEYEGDRKAVAPLFLEHPLSPVCFKAIQDRDASAETLLQQLTASKKERLILEYPAA